MARPKKEFDEKDLETIETFGRIKASYELIGEHFSCSYKTIERRMHDEEGEFCQAYKKGLARTKTLLAHKQIEVAMGGNVAMLIWLGKQYLDQKDKREHTGEDGGPIEFIVTDGRPV